MVKITREKAKEMLPIIQAFAEGKKIETKYDIYDWTETEELQLDSNHKHRIKLEPNYRPFKNQDECWNEMMKHQPFGWFRSTCNKNLFNIICIDDDGIKVTNTLCKSKYTYDRAFSSLKFADGTPFGIRENDR